MSDAIFEIFMDEDEDETLEGKKRVGRLTDMDTQEVSVVDRAANKRRSRPERSATRCGRSSRSTRGSDRPRTIRSSSC